MSVFTPRSQGSLQPLSSCSRSVLRRQCSLAWRFAIPGFITSPSTVNTSLHDYFKGVGGGGCGYLAWEKQEHIIWINCFLGVPGPPQMVADTA